MSIMLPKQSFLALAAVGWADGSLQRTEATGLLRAAKECGVAGDDLADVERATKTKTSIADVANAGDMSQWQVVLTYALASWLAQLDGIQSTDESDTLKKLGDALGLDKALRQRAAAAANDIACLPEGGRPERYDFQKLAARLKERMPQLAG
jgi:uncharacterized membrane protein YebE (DUF533 family)